MNERHILHGRIKRFWVFLAATSLAAFLSNSAIQMLLKGEVDLQGSITISLTLGIVLAIVMSSQHKKGHGE
jgi:hypothetical protein